MRECICGKPIPRRKERGHREREYCSDKCRQRAWRERNKDKHNLDRIMREYHERIHNSVFQDIHRETWQDDIERQQQLINSLFKEIEYLHNENQRQREEIERLESAIDALRNLRTYDAEEITRLKYLLDNTSKKKPR